MAVAVPPGLLNGFPPEAAADLREGGVCDDHDGGEAEVVPEVFALGVADDVSEVDLVDTPVREAVADLPDEAGGGAPPPLVCIDEDTVDEPHGLGGQRRPPGNPTVDVADGLVGLGDEEDAGLVLERPVDLGSNVPPPLRDEAPDVGVVGLKVVLEREPHPDELSPVVRGRGPDLGHGGVYVSGVFLGCEGLPGPAGVWA